MADNCPYCHEPAAPLVGEILVKCPTCAVAYHQNCWTANGNRCAILNCAGAGAGQIIRYEKEPDIEIIEPMILNKNVVAETGRHVTCPHCAGRTVCSCARCRVGANAGSVEDAVAVCIICKGAGTITLPSQGPFKFGYQVQNAPQACVDTLAKFRNDFSDVKQIAIGSNGSWIVLSGKNGWGQGGTIPKELYEKMWEYHKAGHEIKQVAFAPNDGWVMLSGKNGWQQGGSVPKELNEKMWEYHKAGHEIKQVAFAPNDGWVMLSGKNGWQQGGSVPKELNEKMWEHHNTGQEIKQVAFTPDNGCIILIGKNGWWQSGVPNDLSTKLWEYHKAGYEIRNVSLAADNGFGLIGSNWDSLVCRHCGGTTYCNHGNSGTSCRSCLNWSGVSAATRLTMCSVCRGLGFKS